jgi:hypothetical protein
MAPTSGVIAATAVVLVEEWPQVWKADDLEGTPESMELMARAARPAIRPVRYRRHISPWHRVLSLATPEPQSTLSPSRASLRDRAGRPGCHRAKARGRERKRP